MANNNKEIEIKVRVADVAPLIAFLKKEGTFLTEERQVDEYFSPVEKSFISERPVKEWLRVRSANGSYSLNYKKWHFDNEGRSNYCDEFETGVGDTKEVKKILSALNFKSVAIVDKTRRSWQYQEYEISMDEVVGLGSFIEIEYIGKDATVDPKKVTTEMIKFLKNVGCTNITQDIQGYPFLILFPEEAKSAIA
jgi:adenylate cyclase class 2